MFKQENYLANWIQVCRIPCNVNDYMIYVFLLCKEVNHLCGFVGTV